MSRKSRPRCGWAGESPSSEGETVFCLAPATGYVIDREGRRTYCCPSHRPWAAERAEGGFVHSPIRSDDREAPFTHHAVSSQEHYRFAAVGELV